MHSNGTLSLPWFVFLFLGSLGDGVLLHVQFSCKSTNSVFADLYGISWILLTQNLYSYIGKQLSWPSHSYSVLVRSMGCEFFGPEFELHQSLSCWYDIRQVTCSLSISFTFIKWCDSSAVYRAAIWLEFYNENKGQRPPHPTEELTICMSSTRFLPLLPYFSVEWPWKSYVILHTSASLCTKYLPHEVVRLNANCLEHIVSTQYTFNIY